MPSLPTRSFDVIVQTTIAGIQGRASSLIDFGKGSPLLAITRGFASLFMWFQALVIKYLLATRLSTSQGGDVDTFAADFMPAVAGTASPRLGAQAATGLLTLARLTPSPQVLFIPVGSTAQSNDGTKNFAVTQNIADPHYTATPMPGYVLEANVASIIVPAKAVVPGEGGNVAANTITVMTSPLSGIDTVTNVAGFIGGVVEESDSDLKARFSAFILGLARGNTYGLRASVLGAAVGVQFTITEDYDYSGASHRGFFFVVADDGSGSPSAEFMATVTDAVWAVRPLGIQCAIFPPAIKSATVSLEIDVFPGYDRNVIIGLVGNMVADKINALGLGVDLDYFEISSWAYMVAGVKKVRNVRLNSLTGDAASISASKQTQDSYGQMQIYTIKCAAAVVS